MPPLPATPVTPMFKLSISDGRTVSEFLQKLRGEHKVQGLVLDMDRTIVAAHSGGYLDKDEVPEFVARLTPTARELIPAALKEGFDVCIATYSDELYMRSAGPDSVAGTPLVQAVLRSCLTEEQLAKVTIISLNPDLYRLSSGQKRSRDNVLSSPTKTPNRGAAGPMPASSPGPSSSPLSPLSSGPSSPASPEAAAAAAAELENDPTRRFFMEKVSSVLGAQESKLDPSVVELLRRYPPMLNKDHHLHLFSAVRGIPLERLCLIDDSRDNTEGARRLGCLAVHVSGHDGLKDHHLRHISLPSPSAASTPIHARRRDHREHANTPSSSIVRPPRFST